MSAIAVSAVALAAAGCSGSATAGKSTSASVSTVAATGAASGGPGVVTTAQAQSIFSGVTAAISSGNNSSANQTKALAGTYGVFWNELNFDFRTQTQAGKFENPRFIIPSEPKSQYPKWFAATASVKAPNHAPSNLAGVSRPASGPELMTFEKLSPKMPWQLSTAMRLEPGQQLPPVSATPGIAPLDDTTSYLARPDLVGPLQASVVDDGPKAPAASVVTDGPLTTGIYSDEASIKPIAGDIRQWSLQGAGYNRFALRLANGGALVFYSDYLDERVMTPSDLAQANPVKPGPPIPIPAPFKALVPEHELNPDVKLETQYDLDFAAIDPPASAKNAKIQVIAMGGVPTFADARSHG